MYDDDNYDESDIDDDLYDRGFNESEITFDSRVLEAPDAPPIEEGMTHNEWVALRNSIQKERDRPAGTEADPFPDKTPEEILRRTPRGPRDVSRAERQSAPREKPDRAPALRTYREGEWKVDLRRDTDAIRAFLLEREPDLDALLTPAPRGRPTVRNQNQRDRLAVLVAEAIDAGAGLKALFGGAGSILRTCPLSCRAGQAASQLNGTLSVSLCVDGHKRGTY